MILLAWPALKSALLLLTVYIYLTSLLELLSETYEVEAVCCHALQSQLKKYILYQDHVYKTETVFDKQDLLIEMR